MGVDLSLAFEDALLPTILGNATGGIALSQRKMRMAAVSSNTIPRDWMRVTRVGRQRLGRRDGGFLGQCWIVESSVLARSFIILALNKMLRIQCQGAMVQMQTATLPGTLWLIVDEGERIADRVQYAVGLSEKSDFPLPSRSE